MKIRLILMCLALEILPAVCVAQRANISRQVRALHFHSIVVDTHDDTTQRLLDPTFDLGKRHSDGGIDLPRMRDGGLDALFFSIYIPGTITGPKAVDHALTQIDAIRRQVKVHPADLVLATTVNDIRSAAAHHKIADADSTQLNCFESPKYHSILKEIQGETGTDFLIKYKSRPDDKLPCNYVFGKNDFEIKNEWAEYYAGLKGDLLILDSTTGPGPSGFIVWDLKQRKKVFTGSWSDPEESDDHLLV